MGHFFRKETKRLFCWNLFRDSRRNIGGSFSQKSWKEIHIGCFSRKRLPLKGIILLQNLTGRSSLEQPSFSRERLWEIEMEIRNREVSFHLIFWNETKNDLCFQGVYCMSPSNLGDSLEKSGLSPWQCGNLVEICCSWGHDSGKKNAPFEKFCLSGKEEASTRWSHVILPQICPNIKRYRLDQSYLIQHNTLRRMLG
jgi:hypothetical protein